MSLSNWNYSVVTDPQEVVSPRDLDELQNIVRNSELYPTPIRAIGSLHSLNECFTTTGTAVLMEHFTKMNKPDLKNGTVTVGGGVRMIDLMKYLKKSGLQIRVVPEIGNATAGSVACCGTKDASLREPNHLGQISSAVTELKMVDATGASVTIVENSTPSLAAVRSSYGLLGIVYEVTFAVHERTLVKYDYVSLYLDPVPQFDAVGDGADGFLGFLLPYRRQLIVERRRVELPGRFRARFEKAMGCRDQCALWLRTFAWREGARPFPGIPRPLLWLWVWCLDRKLRAFFLWFVGHFKSYRADAMIDFPRRRHSYFEFTFWAFPSSKWSTVVPAYLDFCERFLARTGFRPALPTEVYFIRKDDHAWLSFCRDEDIFTLDMVNWTDYYPAEWLEMNREFNDFAATHGGRPLFNQTKHLSRAVVDRAMRGNPFWSEFAGLRKGQDPHGRFLNAFFQDLLP
jgi:FAD/FMN-containing dehydrogenase